MNKQSKDQRQGKPVLKTSACKGSRARLWLGIDLGDRWSHVCVLDNGGEVVE